MADAAQAYCADCDARGVETRMVPDTDFDGLLCPDCEPIDVKMIGRRADRLARYDRLRTPAQAEVIRQIGSAVREVSTRPHAARQALERDVAPAIRR